jgi:hypothetical protein
MTELALNDKTSSNHGQPKFIRASFFEAYTTKFGSLNSEQIQGLNSLLSSMEYDNELPHLNSMAYLLATVKYETQDAYRPLIAQGSIEDFNNYDPILATTPMQREIAKRNGNTSQGDGYEYRGRGFIQISWKNNYKKLGYTLGYDLINYPDQLLDPLIAYKVMSYGMRKGIFTGKKLSDYLNEYHADYRNARRVINGIHQAELIKNYALKFESLLRFSQN